MSSNNVVPPPSPWTIKVDAVVTQVNPTPNDFPTIQAALDAAASAPRGTGTQFVIHVTAGKYQEYVTVKSNNVTIVGDGIGKTIITGNRSAKGGFKTSDSATLSVEGEGFIGAGFTVENTAGPENEQAVAVMTSADHAAFHKCSFEGYQDTLYAHKGTQFYRDCDIYGTVDFIFSLRGAAVLQNCRIYPRIPGGNGKPSTITADGRPGPNDPFGICIHNCEVSASKELGDALAAGAKIQTYLGRPWSDHSRTVFITTKMDRLVDAAGWLAWPDQPKWRPTTLYYREYKNCGLGAVTKADTQNRVSWPGLHVTVADVSPPPKA
ncbi:unnamed protein product [Cuscuta campestris]|uniref:pectinesterase n=1 Tax=Cuscuta campestris TaxID=132261 RepID=A0A484KGG5_9ASTE|nr:unnamed protein product [Cuscuta campestris]